MVSPSTLSLDRLSSPAARDCWAVDTEWRQRLAYCRNTTTSLSIESHLKSIFTRADHPFAQLITEFTCIFLDSYQHLGSSLSISQSTLVLGLAKSDITNFIEMCKNLLFTAFPECIVKLLHVSCLFANICY
jgi:hypothetical protein